MMLRLEKVLTPEEVARFVDALGKVEFADGKLTAGGAARDAKNNRQVTRDNDLGAVLGQQLISMLTRDERFRAAALPSTFVRPLFARYEPGMAYGDHLDAPFMEPARVRTDVAVTVFLSAAASYEGGELVVDSDYGAVRVRAEAGDVVLYPASSVHRVEPVARGTRLVGVTWVQSMVRDPARRRILYELHTACDGLGAKLPDGPELVLFRKCYSSLLRMWAEV
jgi:PKHD-type hydroxylase